MFKRNGFSLIEFAIVTLILGIAIVIMVPVVLKSQTEARQMGCATRMGNLARAVLAYEDSNGRLPPAGIVDPVGNSALAQQVGSFDSRSGPQFSWIVLTLPYFNQQSVFDAFDLSTDVISQPEEAISAFIMDLMCPTDTRGASTNLTVTDSGPVQFSLGNYAAFISPIHGEHAETIPGALGGFEPGTDEGQRLVEISDGASNTFMLSEVRRRPLLAGEKSTRDTRGIWAAPWMAASTLAAELHAPLGQESPYVPDVRQNPADVMTPNSNQSFADQIINCPSPVTAVLEQMPCSRSPLYPAGISIAAPRSLHGGGVNVAFVNGRVTFITDDINHILFANLISSNNGQPRFTPLRQTRPAGTNRTR